jgi:hypothetical protein
LLAAIIDFDILFSSRCSSGGCRDGQAETRSPSLLKASLQVNRYCTHRSKPPWLAPVQFNHQLANAQRETKFPRAHLSDLASHPQHRPHTHSSSRAMRRIPVPVARAATIAATLSASLSSNRRRPSWVPSALARLRPAITRSRIIARSNSANTPHLEHCPARRRRRGGGAPAQSHPKRKHLVTG